MKTIVVLSDTHGNFGEIDKILPIINESDYCIHLGDFERDILSYKNEIKSKVYSVKGNCDGCGEEQVFDIEGVKTLIVHGDKYDVKSSLFKLYLRAKELDAKLVLYGHTHIADKLEKEGILFVNPGAMARFYDKSYAYIVIHDQKITCKIVKF